MTVEEKYISPANYILIGLTVLSLAGMISFSFYSGVRMNTMYPPMIDAAMDIKLEATTAHLWFEEILHGDRHEKMETVWLHLDQADWYANVMLEGGENHEGKFYALDDLELREIIFEVQKKLAEFRRLTQVRIDNAETSRSGTEADQHYDAVFSEFINKADQVESRLQKIMASDLKRYKIIQIALLITCLILSLILVILFRRLGRRQTEEIASRFGRILDYSFNEICIFDAETLRYTKANFGARNNLGYSMKEFAQLTPFDINPGLTRERFEAIAEPLRSRKKSQVTFETERRRKDGSVYPVEICLQLTLLEDDPVFVVIAQDISDRKNREQLLLKERQNLFDMLDNLPVAFHLQAKDYSVPFANKKFQEIFGKPENRTCYDLMHQRTQPCEICDTFKVFETGETRQSIWHAFNGRVYITVDTPFHDIDGSPLVMEMAIDITEQMKAEEELKKSHDLLESKVEQRTAALAAANHELERSNEALKDFSAFASHDLQAPLRTMVSFGDRLMDMEQNLSAKGEDYLSRMLKAGMRMQKLISGLLEFSKATTIPKKLEAIDLNQVIAEVVSDLESQITKTKATVEAEKLPTIEADHIQMRQLFQNLIGNALKFRKADTPPAVKITSSLNKDGHYDILVEDNGIGFDIKYLDSILQPFHRLHNRSQYEGSGIGLAACQKIVERHSGKINAQSSPGKGATFIITLPKTWGSSLCLTAYLLLMYNRAWLDLCV